MQCDYRIHVAQGSTINLVVTDFDMETDIDCSMDYLSVSNLQFRLVDSIHFK